MYICYHENNVPSWLSPQWVCGNSCTWPHDVPHIPGYLDGFTRQEKMYFVMVGPATTVKKYFKKVEIALTFSRKFQPCCVIRAKSKTINFNVRKAKYEINKIYLIKVKRKLMIAANLRLRLYAQIRFSIRHWFLLGYNIFYTLNYFIL